PHPRTDSHRVRGMTLVEVMVVVVIVGVLSSLAIYGVSRYIRSAESSEAYAVINAIRGAQEVYRQDTFQYLDVSAGDFGTTHPTGVPSNSKQGWGGTLGVAGQNFRLLGVEVDSGTYFTYACVAGRAGDAFPTPPTDKKEFGFPENASEPFYV